MGRFLFFSQVWNSCKKALGGLFENEKHTLFLPFSGSKKHHRIFPRTLSELWGKEESKHFLKYIVWSIGSQDTLQWLKVSKLASEPRPRLVTSWYGTGMIRPRTFLPRMICPRTLSPDVFMSPYVSSPKESQPTELPRPMDWLGI